MPDIISKFTNHLKTALTRALCLVVETKGESITPLHLLWALSTQQGCVAAEVLIKSGVDVEGLRRKAGDNGSISKKPISEEQNFIPILSEESKNIIEKAVLTANVYEHRYVGTEHLLAGLLQMSPSDIQSFFNETKTDVHRIRTTLSGVFKTTAAFPDFPETQKAVTDALQELEALSVDEPATPAEDESKTPAIDYFTDELTDAEAVKTFTPVVGREAELARLTKILCRRQKNNPILVGKPGVGKTAIVEGLAKQIVDGNVPPALENRRLLQLDLASMIAGTMYRGEFESRLRQLIDEVTELPEIILFIDELHMIMGAGAASGSLDAANILKPALARGDIRCIGATTPDEFKKHIEPDGALERRFQQITVEEPTAEETKHILSGIKTFYEDYHDVVYPVETLHRAVELAERYFPSKAFPDKAIDIIDEAGAAITMTRRNRFGAGLSQLRRELETVREQKKQAVHEERFAEAMKFKTREEKLELEMGDVEAKKIPRKPSTVNADGLLAIVAEMCAIPLEELTASEHKELVELPKRLKSEVIGQEKAVEEIAHAIRRAKLGLAKKDEPLASFLFLGPSGVGKTHLAKTLASILFKDANAFLRLDMSEYAEPYTVSKLIGSPAGYVGYREKTKLTDHVKAHPYSIVLFDELEKAHRDIHSLLLQILDDGMLTDATGKKINFRNTIIIITTNAGREYFERGGIGFASTKSLSTEKNSDIREKLEESFAAEFLNRIRHMCVFEPLSAESLELIAQKELENLIARIEKKNIRCSLDAKVPKLLAAQVREKVGARDIHRLIEESVEREIATILLKRRKTPAGIRISADKQAHIVVKVV